MKVVVIDDNTVNIAVLRAMVRHLPDCECVEFTDPSLALQWCTTQEPDLVLVDYMMPAMNGLDFLRAFRAITGCAEVPVLMITASHETELRHNALNQGVNDFLTKPVDRVEFLARSRNMLALRKSQKALSDRAAWLSQEVAKATAEISNRELDTIFRLSKAAEYRDPETGAHVLRMAHYSRLIGAKLGLPEAELNMLFHAAPMHDVGKVGTPDHILLKPGRLTDDEMTIMRQHATIGYEILCDSPSPCLQLAAIIAHSHHEKFDGTGYPAGLKGEAIPLVGRIVAVADVFDALNSERPYKEGWPLDKARQYIEENAGTHFDPACVRAFLSSWLDVLEIRARYRDDPQDAALHRALPPYLLQSKETA
ncbi:MAG: HD domain-containing phosphohydrolase [Burkholderiales bacterium]